MGYLAAGVRSDGGSLWMYQVLGLLVIVVLIVVPVLVIRARRRAGSSDDPAKLFLGIAGVQAGQNVSLGLVRIRFTIYSGFLVYVTQRRYDVALPPEHAKLVLGRAIKHNCTAGFFAYGALFIPILSYLEYRSQMKLVNDALRPGFPVKPK